MSKSAWLTEIFHESLNNEIDNIKYNHLHLMVEFTAP